MALLIPFLMLLLFGVFEVARVFYTYHTLQKAVRGGAGVLARSANVNFCNPSDPAMIGAANVIVWGNLQGSGPAIVQDSEAQALLSAIQIIPETVQANSSAVAPCCGLGQGDPNGCDPTLGGRTPDFIVVNLGAGGFPVNVLFPFVNLNPPTVTLQVSVRMAVTGS
jgi:Flp pilus assembly protein TadG